MGSPEVVIEAKGLTKKFDDFTAVDHIDFKVYKGECVGFLGPNGAGKTTTVRMMYCFLPATEGRLNRCRLKRPHAVPRNKSPDWRSTAGGQFRP